MKVRSMRGHEVDIGALMTRHETSVAVGNASMNARGDVIGKGGSVIQSRDEIAQEYHRSNPKAVRNVSLSDLSGEMMPVGSDKLNIEFADPAEAVEAITKRKRKIEDTE